MPNLELIQTVVTGAADRGHEQNWRKIEVALPISFDQLEDTEELGMIVRNLEVRFNLLPNSFCGSDYVDDSHEILFFRTNT